MSPCGQPFYCIGNCVLCVVTTSHRITNRIKCYRVYVLRRTCIYRPALQLSGIPCPDETKKKKQNRTAENEGMPHDNVKCNLPLLFSAIFFTYERKTLAAGKNTKSHTFGTCTHTHIHKHI